MTKEQLKKKAYKALKYGILPLLKYLVEVEQYDLNTMLDINSNHQSACTLAINTLNEELVRYCFSNGLKSDAIDSNSLNYLLKKENYNFLEFLVEKECVIRNEKYTSYYSNAIQENNLDALKLFIKYTKLLNIRTDIVFEWLQDALCRIVNEPNRVDEQIIELILEQIDDINNYELLDHLFPKGKQSFDFLVKHGFDFNRKDNPTKLINLVLGSRYSVFNRFYTSIKYYPTNVIETLVYFMEQGINLNTTNNYGNNALFFYFTNRIYNEDKDYDILHFLINNNININQLDTYGKNVLFYIQKDGSEQEKANLLGVVKILIEKGIDIHCKDIFGNNCVKNIALNNQLEVLKLLVEHQVDYSILSTLLEKLFDEKAYDIIEYCVKDLSIVEDFLFQKIDWLFERREYSLVKVLIDYKSSFNPVEPIKYFKKYMEMNDLEMISILIDKNILIKALAMELAQLVSECTNKQIKTIIDDHLLINFNIKLSGTVNIDKKQSQITLDLSKTISKICYEYTKPHSLNILKYLRKLEELNNFDYDQLIYKTILNDNIYMDIDNVESILFYTKKLAPSTIEDLFFKMRNKGYDHIFSQLINNFVTPKCNFTRIHFSDSIFDFFFYKFGRMSKSGLFYKLLSTGAKVCIPIQAVLNQEVELNEFDGFNIDYFETMLYAVEHKSIDTLNYCISKGVNINKVKRNKDHIFRILINSEKLDLEFMKKVIQLGASIELITPEILAEIPATKAGEDVAIYLINEFNLNCIEIEKRTKEYFNCGLYNLTKLLLTKRIGNALPSNKEFISEFMQINDTEGISIILNRWQLSNDLISNLMLEADKLNNEASYYFKNFISSGKKEKPKTLKQLINTELISAVTQNDILKVKELIQQGANSKTLMENGKPVVLYSTMNNYFEITGLLIEHGAQINACTKNKDYLIHLCIEANKIELVELLVKKGCKMDVENSRGRSPYLLAIELDFPEIVHKLVELHVGFDGYELYKILKLASENNIQYMHIIETMLTVNDDYSKYKPTDIYDAGLEVNKIFFKLAPKYMEEVYLPFLSTNLTSRYYNNSELNSSKKSIYKHLVNVYETIPHSILESLFKRAELDILSYYIEHKNTTEIAFNYNNAVLKDDFPNVVKRLSFILTNNLKIVNDINIRKIVLRSLDYEFSRKKENTIINYRRYEESMNIKISQDSIHSKMIEFILLLEKADAPVVDVDYLLLLSILKGDIETTEMLIGNGYMLNNEMKSIISNSILNCREKMISYVKYKLNIEIFCNLEIEYTYGDIIDYELLMLKLKYSDNYVMKNASEYIKYFIDEDDDEAIENLIKKEMISNRNITTYLTYAMDNKKENCIIVLLNKSKDRNKNNSEKTFEL